MVCTVYFSNIVFIYCHQFIKIISGIIIGNLYWNRKSLSKIDKFNKLSSSQTAREFFAQIMLLKSLI